MHKMEQIPPGGVLVALNDGRLKPLRRFSPRRRDAYACRILRQCVSC